MIAVNLIFHLDNLHVHWMQTHRHKFRDILLAKETPTFASPSLSLLPWVADHLGCISTHQWLYLSLQRLRHGGRDSARRSLSSASRSWLLRDQSFMLISSPQCTAAMHSCGWLKAVGHILFLQIYSFGLLRGLRLVLLTDYKVTLLFFNLSLLFFNYLVYVLPLFENDINHMNRKNKETFCL